MAASLVENDGAKKSAIVAVTAFVVALGATGLMQLVLMLLSAWFDWRMQREQMPLTTLWSHVLNDGRKVTHLFTTIDESLGALANERAEGSDEQEELLSVDRNGGCESEDETKSTLDADDASSSSNTTPDASSVVRFATPKNNSSSESTPPTISPPLPVDDLGGSNSLLETTSSSVSNVPDDSLSVSSVDL